MIRMPATEMPGLQYSRTRPTVSQRRAMPCRLKRSAIIGTTIESEAANALMVRMPSAGGVSRTI